MRTILTFSLIGLFCTLPVQALPKPVVKTRTVAKQPQRQFSKPKPTNEGIKYEMPAEWGGLKEPLTSLL